MRRFPRACPSLMALAALLASPAATQVSPVPAGATQPVADVTINMRGVEISDVADQISRITGRTLILDPSVKGQVNVTSAEPLTPAGVWDLFQSVLRVHGYAAVRSGRVWRIVPQANAVKDSGAATGGRVGNQEVVTRLIRLRNVPADAAARVLRPLVASFGSIESLPSPNAIVVTDYADNVRRIERIADSLDNGGGAGVEAIPLEHASARDVATAIQGVIGDANTPGGPRVAADERSNTVLVRGEPNAIAQARRLARVLDQPGGATPVTRLFRLNNADAESVTEVLRGLLGEGGAATNPVARSLARPRLAASGVPLPPQLSAGSPSGGSLAELGSAAGLGAGGALSATGSGGSGVGALVNASAGGQPTAQGFSTPELTVQPAPEINAIVVRGTPSVIASIEPLINDLDVRRPQVLIEAAIAEITGDDAEALGVQLGLGAAAVNVPDSASTSFDTLGLPLRTILGALGAPASIGVLPNGLSGNVRITDNFSILVQALGTSTKANLLSTPSITTLDNEPAEIVVGQNVPFVTGSFTTNGNSLNPFTTIERQDVGLTLRIVPRIHRGDVVKLEVSQEVSSLTNAALATGARDLITNRRSIQTTVLADNGQTIVLGGLISDDRTLTKSQVPILGDVPVLGELFKSRRNQQTKRTLFVFLRPTILRDRDATAAVTAAKYGRLRGDEAVLDRPSNLLVNPPKPRLTQEISGVY